MVRANFRFALGEYTRYVNPKWWKQHVNLSHLHNGGHTISPMGSVVVSKHEGQRMSEKGMDLSSEQRRRLQVRLDRASAEDDGSGMLITREIGEIGRELGVQRLCRTAQLERTSFYRTFDGVTDPRLSNLMRAVRALGLVLTLR